MPKNSNLSTYPAADQERVFICSPWVKEKCENDPEFLATALEQNSFTQVYDAHFYTQQLNEFNPTDFPQLAKQLRQFRQRSMIRIIWRMSLQWANLEETVSDLSALADACVQFAEQRLFTWLGEKYGVPVNEQGEPEHLVVVALGKLGGYELNLSSDIDLLFAYPQDGMLGGSGLSYAEFYLRLGQQLIKVLHEINAEGYVFRVDMRLRPFGESGPLAVSFSAFKIIIKHKGANGNVML